MKLTKEEIDWLRSLNEPDRDLLLGELPMEVRLTAMRTLGMDTGSRHTREIDRQSKVRASERDLIIPEVADSKRRADLEQDDEAWLAYYLEDVFYNPFTQDQSDLIADARRCLDYGTMKCKAAPRGDGKSSIVKYLMLKYALERRVIFPMVLAATFTKSRSISDSLRRRLSSRKRTRLSLDYPLECYVARYVDGAPQRSKSCTANGGRPIHVEWGGGGAYFILPSWADEDEMGAIVMSLGWTSDDLQGCNVYDMRPDFVMIDDLDSRDSLAADHGLIAGKIVEVIDKTVAGLRGQSRRMGQLYACTITSTDAAAYIYSEPKKKPAWDGERVAAIKTWPTDTKAWDEYIRLRQKGMMEGDEHAREAHDYYLANKDTMDAGADVSNEWHYDGTTLPDGSMNEVSNLEHCFNFVADNGREAFDTEYQQDPPKRSDLLELKVNAYAVSSCTGDHSRQYVDPEAPLLVAGVDVRKIELHDIRLARSDFSHHHVCDYDVNFHGKGEITVQQAEYAILDGLRALQKRYRKEPIRDENGTVQAVDLTLIDKGWVGNWTEDALPSHG